MSDSTQQLYDSVHRPSHYTEGRKYESRKVIHDWGLNFNLGNVVKYIARAGRKGPVLEDLEKAKQYLEFEIEELKEATVKEIKDPADSIDWEKSVNLDL